MFDHLTKLRDKDRGRTAAGLAVSLLLHLALLALIVVGASAVRDGGAAMEVSGDAPVAGPRLPPPPGAPEQADDGGGGEVLDLGIPAGAPLPGLDAPAEVELPQALRLGRAFTVRLRLPPPVRPEEPTVRIAAGGGADTLEARISPVRTAALSATRMLVSTEGSMLQLADTARPLLWEWTLRPTEPGPQQIHVRLEAVAQVDGVPRVVSLYRTRSEITVEAGFLQRASRFFAHHWTWLSLLALVLLLAWARERFRRAPAAPPEARDSSQEQSTP